MSLETMTKLASTTVGVTAQSSISFTNIPQGYTDLVIKVSGRTAAAQGVSELSFNSVTTNLSSRIIYGIGSGSPGSASYASALRAGYIVGTDYTASVFSNNEIYISNYSSNTFKSVTVDSVGENNATEAYSSLNSGLWSNPSPITSLTFTVLNNGTGAASTFTQHSTFTLYGIKNAAQTAGNSIKATGGNIVFDGTYVYHVFNASGSFVPTQSILADALVIAGGGSGGGGTGTNGGGGGGAGGLRGLSNISLNSGITYACTIGAGGAAANATQNSGSNSIFSTTSATGGGAGGQNAASNKNGLTGGSGGGAGATSAVNGTGGTGNSGGYSPVEGYGGGNGSSNGTTYDASGGGGGAGGAGANATSSACGAGGVGVSTYSSWGLATGQGQNVSGTYYFAGGGGGGCANYVPAGAGGLGGGGNGNLTSGVNNGTANTGSGGGGGSNVSLSNGSGGSGIVIIRYKG
jgi:hypothetical protein